jgi:hypothetical protein
MKNRKNNFFSDYLWKPVMLIIDKNQVVQFLILTNKREYFTNKKKILKLIIKIS